MSSEQKYYSHILHELENRGNYEVTASSRDISKLEGIRKLLSELGNPQKSFKIIHIAGTNGKGLTGAMLSQILFHSGHNVGLYSSPHVTDIRERIVLNGKWVGKINFAQKAQVVLEAADKCEKEVYLSYFDVFTAIALLVFQDAQMDWVILETGLGGKADSTNISDKELCIITQIDYDHVNVLGNSIEEIVKEKMGIARPGVPIILGKQTEHLTSWILQEFKEFSNQFVLVDQLKVTELTNKTYSFQWPDGNTNQWNCIKGGLSFPYLECLQNALIASLTLLSHSSDPLSRQKWIESATGIELKGRLEFQRKVYYKFEETPFSSMIFDGGHNASAIAALVKQLKSWKVKNYALIVGIAEDKLISQLRTPLLELCQGAKHIILTKANSFRAASPEMIKDFLSKGIRENHPQFQKVSTIIDALNSAYPFRDFPVVISGSFYLLGEAFQVLDFKKK